MFTLYDMSGGTIPNEIRVEEDFNKIKQHLIFVFQKRHRLTKEKAVLLVELGIPVTLKNGDFITLTEEQDQVTIKTDSSSIHYFIIKP